MIYFPCPYPATGNTSLVSSCESVSLCDPWCDTCLLRPLSRSRVCASHGSQWGCMACLNTRYYEPFECVWTISAELTEHNWAANRQPFHRNPSLGRPRVELRRERCGPSYYPLPLLFIGWQPYVSLRCRYAAIVKSWSLCWVRSASIHTSRILCMTNQDSSQLEH
jgi:hypothetical protein